MHRPDLLPFELVLTPSGACTLRALEERETFHPGIGPKAEAEEIHVRAQRLAERAAAHFGTPFVVWDVGLGAAANAIAAIEALADSPAEIELHSFERDLRAAQFAGHNSEALGYVEPHRETLERVLRDGVVQTGSVKWHLHCGDFTDPGGWSRAAFPHAILYDPYSPKANPTLWTLEHFRALRTSLHNGPPCTLSSYSRSSAVRVTLLLAGFYVGFGPATGEKDQTTLAATDPSLLERQLDSRWLERVRRSTAGAPLRLGAAAGPISSPDWQSLIDHPQFRT